MLDQLFSLDNLFRAWRVFKSGKSRKKDVVNFEYHLEDNIFALHEEIISGKYQHRPYQYFQIFDTKKRDIFKAHVRDRIVHQIIYDHLKSIYEPIFIADSYSSRDRKGHHKAVRTFRYFINSSTNGSHSTCFVLKCDIKKYFENVNHMLLLHEIQTKVPDLKIFTIIKNIVLSFHSKKDFGKGIPLGNITSQIFANMYLHTLDMYVKKDLKCRYYIRYNDDFIIICHNKDELIVLRNKILTFVAEELKLKIPLEKTNIRKVPWGIDFLGYIVLSDAVLLKNSTKHKMFSRATNKNVHSYFGMLKHCNSRELRQKLVAEVMTE